MKELHRFGLMKADVIESMYGERLTMVKEAMRSRRDENKTVYRAQVRPLRPSHVPTSLQRGRPL